MAQRHLAHDLLATTYGQSILFELYGASQNVPLLLGSLRRWFDEDETRVVPLPLMKGVETFSDDVGHGH